jgi:hypothetical protein
MTSGAEDFGDADQVPVAPRWQAVACGAAAAVGVAWAAAYVSIKGVERDVGIAAWVAAAVVGASATISAAGPPRPFPRLARRVRRLEKLSGEQAEPVDSKK